MAGRGTLLSPWGSRAHVYARQNRGGAVTCAGLCARVRAIFATGRASLVWYTRGFACERALDFRRISEGTCATTKRQCMSCCAVCAHVCAYAQIILCTSARRRHFVQQLRGGGQLLDEVFVQRLRWGGQLLDERLLARARAHRAFGRRAHVQTAA